jgi:hypothetical protein
MEALKNQRFTAMHNQEMHDGPAHPERELQVASTYESSSKRRTFTKLRNKIGPLELTFGLTLCCKPITERLPENRTVAN